MRLIDADALQTNIALYMAENAYLNDTALDVLKMIGGDWLDKEPTVEVVHCEHCTIKKAVPHKDGMIWRCPHRTGDVKMDGYCEMGVRGNEC